MARADRERPADHAHAGAVTDTLAWLWAAAQVVAPVLLALALTGAATYALFWLLFVGR